MDPRIVNKPGSTVVGLKYRGKNENLEIPELWGDFGERFSEYRHRSEEGIAYGIMDNFDHIYQEWLPASDYQRQPGPEFELYDERFDPHDPESELDVYISIKIKEK